MSLASDWATQSFPVTLVFSCNICDNSWSQSENQSLPEPPQMVLAQALQREILQQQLEELKLLRSTTAEVNERQQALERAIALTMFLDNG